MGMLKDHCSQLPGLSLGSIWLGRIDYYVILSTYLVRVSNGNVPLGMLFLRIMWVTVSPGEEESPCSNDLLGL